jgi:RNA polymerase sigma-70 factor, ECF subfamily
MRSAMRPRPAHVRLVTAPPSGEQRQPAAPSERPPQLGSADDLAVLYRAYAPYVAAIAVRILGRDCELDDLVQDTFVNALRGLRSVREPLAIKGWLATIAVRLATRRLRARRLRRALHLEQDVLDYESICAPSASDEERALVAKVYRVLDGLPAADRVAWVLRNVQGEPLHRLPELCACSLSTAQRRLARAQAAIEKELDHG